MKKKYIVRAFLLSQHMMPFVRIAVKSKRMAIAMAEVMMEEQKFHYVTITNMEKDEEIISFKRDLVWS